MGMKDPSTTRRRDPAAIVEWAIAFVVLGLLTVTLLSMPYQLYAVRTGSMEPSFGPRALVVVHKGEWQQGQPISFTHDGEVVTHRLVSVNSEGTFVTKGDANATADPWVVGRTETIGGVVASVPQLGYWLIYLKTIAGLASVFFAVAGMWLLWPIARELDLTRSDALRDGGHSALDLVQPATERVRTGALFSG